MYILPKMRIIQSFIHSWEDRVSSARYGDSYSEKERENLKYKCQWKLFVKCSRKKK